MLTLPDHCYLPINRCNLPAQILGGLTFQQHPVALLIDSVNEIHKNIFKQLDAITSIDERTELFMQYMNNYFELNNDDTYAQTEKDNRIKANYLYILRGWLFNSNNREGAVIKGWAESRFGLLPRWHKTKITNSRDQAYSIYMHERTTGVYTNNSIEQQLDLLYTFCQYELRKRFPTRTHMQLFRGTDFLAEYDVIENNDKKNPVLLLNNINSFSSNHERADEFGSKLIEISVPTAKIFYFNKLFPGKFQGEEEHLVLGGLYRARIR